MVGWRHQLNGHEFEQAPGDGEGQGNGMLQSMGQTLQSWALPKVNSFALQKTLLEVQKHKLHITWRKDLQITYSTKKQDP